jgi:hypothetical protein
MDNGEIRNRVLVRLCRKYYGIWLSSAIDAEQVVRYAAILSENSDLVYRNINYLAQSSPIKEEKPLEEKNPECISITHYGIDTIERKEEEFAKLHDDIRLNFLPSYMNTILGDHKESTILIDINFIKFVRSNESDQNFVIGDINYLDRKGLIKGLRQFGVLLLCSEYFEE